MSGNDVARFWAIYVDTPCSDSAFFPQPNMSAHFCLEPFNSFRFGIVVPPQIWMKAQPVEDCIPALFWLAIIVFLKHNFLRVEQLFADNKDSFAVLAPLFPPW